MASISTRKSVLGVMVETTEGTPVPPAAATDYVALQDDFELAPEFEQLENAELRASIGRAKTITGAENPTGSMSHYLRHSGVEGQEPNYGKILHAAFGAKAVAGTQYATAAASTTSILKTSAGVADNFQRGQGLLIKDPVNGYRIRALDAAAGTDLTLGFQVPVAPGSGVNLGKCALYKPANDGHPALSLWHYLGNAGAVALLAGARVTELGIEANAGELITANFGFEGLEYFFDPITIASTDRYLDFTDDDGTFAAIVTAKVYKDPHELAAAIQQAMNDTASNQTYTVTYSNDTGKFTIKGTGTLLTLKWNTGTNAANTIGDKIGFSTAADSSGTGATTGYTSANAQSYAAPHTPTYDDSDPLAAKANEVMIGDAADYVCFEASSCSLNLANGRAPIESLCATSGRSGSIINSREATINVTALLNQYDADKFRRFRDNVATKFQYSFGAKSGGNWVAGKCGYFYTPTATIVGFNVVDKDGLAALELELRPYVNNAGLAEIFAGFV